MKNTFTILLISIVLSLSSFVSVGQASICLGIDAVVCPGNTITINDCGGVGAGGSPVPYVTGVIPYAPDPFSGTNVFLSDDSFSPSINIGFDFCFYGATYNQLVISSNNLVSFNTGYAGGYSSWVTSTIPTAAVHLNSIMGPWQDINPNAGGTVSYASYGVAPNRRFVISWNAVPMFSCGTSYTSQIILFETTNLIETHIQDKFVCAGWNSGNAVHGVQNGTGTDALTVPGRNNTQWTTTNEGYLFTPQSTITWTNNLGATFPYNAGVLNITTIPPGVTGYWLESASCGPGSAISDTSWISSGGSSVTASAIDDICSAGIGEVTATPTSGLAPYTYDWTTLGNNPNQTVTGVSAGAHTVIMTDANGCSSTATVVVGDTPAAFSGSITVVSCPGGNDGTAFAEMIPLLGTVTYQWDDPALQTTQTATGLTAGTYNCTITSTIGCAGVVTVNVTETPGMLGVISSQTDVTCNSGSDGIITVSITQGTAPFTYSWDNSTSITNSATDLAVGPHTVTVTDANGCIITVNGILVQPTSLAISSLTPTTQICPEDDILLSVTGTGGSTPYTFTWSQGPTILGTGTSITVDPSVTNTQYCVTLSEACGSPIDQECTIIYFPTPIEPSATPDESENCMPGYFEFTHTSSNTAEIATTYWDFGDNQGASLELADDSTSYQYNAVGVYDVIMITTSIYGCIYTDTMKQIVQVKPNPIADFTFSSNPATIFESEGIQLQDRSSNDALFYSWYSPFSTPSTSSLTQPVFDFPATAGQYPVTLIVETALGCLDSTTINMNVITDILFFAPNAFTPDGDELNQTWKVEVAGVDIYDFELFIFNRWGEIIWETRDPSIGWDGTYKGKIVMSGSYIWKANVKDLYTDEKVQFNGNINLLK
jgi:gliding motility-associated-like protein